MFQPEKAMAPNSSILAWKTPWMEEPGRLQSVRGVVKSWTRLSNFTFTSYYILTLFCTTCYKCLVLLNLYNESLR